ncbi:hypothetical protein IV203_034662 [Nitzschia inconspicua]|uniref:Uncharacterized protein n=1 Tax=Nitzschia inconspicua TaxID=303405 RepID=A0A9K3PWD6_9STRA|nr:hypothetical protein IV203_034662 [Nitzschia inconspicua]
MEELGTKFYDESSDDCHGGPLHRFGGGGGVATLRAGSHEWEDQHRLYHSSHDSDTRSQCSQRSGYSSAGGGGDHLISSLRSVGSDGTQGSGDYRGANNSAGLPLHLGHVHFGSAAHLLSGDATHQFPPSMYQASVDAPKSDAATVCSGSVLEDIEVESHVSGETEPAGSSKYHPSPPSSVKMAHLSGLRRSNSAEGNRLVDFADRSQEALASVFPQQHYRQGSQVASSTVESMSTGTSVTGTMDDDTDMASIHNSTGRVLAGMGPPLSRSWLLQQHGLSYSRPGSVKSFESNTGSDVVAHVGSDCGGSLTDAQSVLSQEDALMAAASESGDVLASSDAAKAETDGICETTIKTDEENAQMPHPLLCNQSNNKNGRISPGGTIYRGRGVRRYKGRFMHLPLKRFHHNGVHLSLVGERGDGDANDVGHTGKDYDDRWRDRGYSALEDEYQRGDHNYYGQTRRRTCRSRSRSRSRSTSPPTCNSEERKSGYHRQTVGRNDRYNPQAGRGYAIDPLPNGRNGFMPSTDGVSPEDGVTLNTLGKEKSKGSKS